MSAGDLSLAMMAIVSHQKAEPNAGAGTAQAGGEAAPRQRRRPGVLSARKRGAPASRIDRAGPPSRRLGLIGDEPPAPRAFVAIRGRHAEWPIRQSLYGDHDVMKNIGRSRAQRSTSGWTPSVTLPEGVADPCADVDLERRVHGARTSAVGARD